jgi:2-amino-4-hydroxy-6-hydroxymethyldihydropteridine diphosphokinase
MTRAVLSLGSNLGDRLGYLRLAVSGLGETLVATSPVYETKAWGVEDQPDFLNAIVVVDDPAADAWAWLRRGQALEQQAGRVRTHQWGPRTLDVDVVTVDGVTSDHPDLLLPHPGTPDRATVLIPWLSIDPTATLPGHGPITLLLAALSDQSKEDVRLRNDLTLTP